MRSITELIYSTRTGLPRGRSNPLARPWPLATLRWPASHWLRPTLPEPHPRLVWRCGGLKIHDPNHVEGGVGSGEQILPQLVGVGRSIHNGHQDLALPLTTIWPRPGRKGRPRGRVREPAFGKNPNSPPARRWQPRKSRRGVKGGIGQPRCSPSSSRKAAQWHSHVVRHHPADPRPLNPSCRKTGSNPPVWFEITTKGLKVFRDVFLASDLQTVHQPAVGHGQQLQTTA